jgi:hypothetical protein
LRFQETVPERIYGMFKRQHAYHALWFVAALGAYGIGTLNRDRSAAGGSRSNPSVVAVPMPPGNPGLARLAVAGDEATGVASGPQAAGVRAPLTKAEIESVAREAFNDPNPLKRQLAFARLLEGLTPENAEQIREQMRGGRANGDQWQLFQYAWGAADGVGALAAAAKIENADRRNGALAQALSGWASADPQQAIAWLGQVENKEERTRLQGSLVGGLADHDIGFATRYVLDLAAAGDGNAAGFMRTVASEQLRKEGPAASAQWAETLPDGDAKTTALEQVANRYVDNDPAAAAAWASQFATVEYGARVIDEVGEEYAERDPGAAVKWLLGLPEGRAQQAGMHGALGEWARRDPTAASQFLIDLPQSPLKDQAVSGFVRRVAWEDPESAIAWARTIAQESTRGEAMTRAAQAWFIRDREAALQWLPTSGLSAEAQKRVLETKRDGRRGRG